MDAAAFLNPDKAPVMFDFSLSCRSTRFFATSGVGSVAFLVNELQ